MRVSLSVFWKILSYKERKLRLIVHALAPIVSNGRHSYSLFARQAVICEWQARREHGTQTQPIVYAQSTLKSKPGALRN